MPPRGNNAITMMIAEAQKKLDEGKGIEYFGGDSLNLTRYENIFTLPGGVDHDYCYRVTMTPTKPEFTMPLDTTLKAAEAGVFYSTLDVERVPKTDGTFEWLVYGHQFSFDVQQRTSFAVIYSGVATFQITQIA